MNLEKKLTHISIKAIKMGDKALSKYISGGEIKQAKIAIRSYNTAIRAEAIKIII